MFEKPMTNKSIEYRIIVPYTVTKMFSVRQYNLTIVVGYHFLLSRVIKYNTLLKLNNKSQKRCYAYIESDVWKYNWLKNMNTFSHISIILTYELFLCLLYDEIN